VESTPKPWEAEKDGKEEKKEEGQLSSAKNGFPALSYLKNKVIQEGQCSFRLRGEDTRTCEGGPMNGMMSEERDSSGKEAEDLGVHRSNNENFNKRRETTLEGSD